MKTLLVTALVLAATLTLATAGEKPIPAAVLKKLHPEIVLALKKSRGEPPFDKATAVEPDIPFKDGDNVLVDFEVTPTADLTAQIARVGKIANSPDPAHVIRAMVPIGQVETLAGRAEVKSISPASVSLESGVRTSPTR